MKNFLVENFSSHEKIITELLIENEINADEINADEINADEINVDEINVDLIENEINADLIENENADEINKNTNKISKPKISIIDDANLPSFDLSLSEAMIEMMKNPKCVPFKVYFERLVYLKKKHDTHNKLTFKDLPTINDKLLPSINLTLPIAIIKIKENKQCVPFDSYVKRWNELKTKSKYTKIFS
jgi:hypothetical protein